MIKITVVIPTFNRKEYLKKILNQLQNQSLNINLCVDIIVVNDGASDGTTEMLISEFPQAVSILGNGHWWYTKSMNEGFKAAEKLNPDFVLTLNDDIILADDYLDKLSKVINSIDSNTIVNSISFTSTKPHLLLFGGVKKYIRWRGKRIPYFRPFSLLPLYKLNGLYPTCIISGRGILVPYHILKELNYFDEKFPQYASDDDFGLRAIYAGYKVMISRDLKIFENTKLTSKGVPYNRDGTITLIKSFFNKHSVNSLQTTLRFGLKHGYPIILPLWILISIAGTFYAYFLKYRNIKPVSYER